jgi:cytochrome c-type biogenesis protein
MDLSLFIPAFIAGILMFLAPCTLPLVPGYLGFISGVSLSELGRSDKISRLRLKIFLNGLFFVLGFSLIFILLGVLAGWLGSSLVPYRLWLTKIGGIFVIFFGLFMLGVWHPKFLEREKRLPLPRFMRRGSFFSSALLGAAFGFGWTPCVGPILATMLFLASTQGTVAQGAVLLVIFSLGLSLPFLLLALMISQATKIIRRLQTWLRVITVIGGLFLILLGIMLFFNKLGLSVGYGYRLLDFINYSRLVDYL